MNEKLEFQGRKMKYFDVCCVLLSLEMAGPQCC